MPGGSLTSKPTWWNSSGCSAASAFLFRWCRTVTTTRRIPIDISNPDMAKRVAPAACDFERQSTGNLPQARITNRLGSKNGDGMSLDRATLSSTQLYQSAIREELQLTQEEIDRVSPDYLFVLAITEKLELSQRDKDRLRPLHLAHLAVTEKIVLRQEDKARLPTELLFELFVQGFVGLSEDERTCFTAAQLERLRQSTNTPLGRSTCERLI